MQKVFVLDNNKQPLAPCHSARARQMLKDGRAAVYRRFPFTIILKDRVGGDVQPIQIKIDPGSKQTGIALVQDNQGGQEVVWAGEVQHRGQQIKDALEKRRSLRRGRRQRGTRYRQPRFLNRRRPEGWLSPSIKSRVDNVQTWFVRLFRLVPISGISMELVKFDTHKMVNPEISGVEYQQGELAGYEVREYLLEKWSRKCAYCGAKDCPLEIEHIVPKSRGGSNRVSNLTLACHSCNQRKGNQTAAEFGHPGIHAKARVPLKDAAAVNAARWELWRRLDATGLPLETGTGARTKFNRVSQDYPKSHWIDAACVGVSGESVHLDPAQGYLIAKSTGRGGRQMQRVNGYGFPCASPRERVKRRGGFQSGDVIRASVPAGKYAGVWVGRIAENNKTGIRLTRPSDPKTRIGATKNTVLTIVHRNDGYKYDFAKLDYQPRRRVRVRNRKVLAPVQLSLFD